MKTRVITSLIGIPILFLALYFYNYFVFNIIVAMICILAFYEIISAFRISHAIWLYCAIVPMALIVILSDHDEIRGFMPLLFFLFIVYIAVCVIFEVKELTFAQVSEVIFFCGIVLFGFYSIISFKILFPLEQYGYDSLYLILLGFGFAWGGDSAAYLIGVRFGKHKLAPRVSPNKTIEGAIGAIFGSMLLGCLFTWGYSALLPLLETGESIPTVGLKSYLTVCGVGIVASVLGMMGDLFTSAIKRQCGIKDYGSIFPGHGGILDRFDSVLLVMPFVSLVSRWLPFISR